MKYSLAILSVGAFVFGCIGGKDAHRTPQQELQYHVDQPEQKSERIVEDAIREGADVNTAVGGELLPWLAASKGYDESRVYEGTAKAPEQLNLAEGSNNPAASGSKPYQDAAIAVLGVLRRHGANKDVTDSLGENALHKAVLAGRVRVLEYLLSVGVGMDVQDRAGYTPLMRAVGMEHLELAKMLLSHGASITPQSKYGQNALRLAEESGKTDLIEAMKARGIPTSELVK